MVKKLLDRKVSGKSKDEQMAEKKQELEKRLQDVSGQLGTNKKQQPKKGIHYFIYMINLRRLLYVCVFKIKKCNEFYNNTYLLLYF